MMILVEDFCRCHLQPSVGFEKVYHAVCTLCNAKAPAPKKPNRCSFKIFYLLLYFKFDDLCCFWRVLPDGFGGFRLSNRIADRPGTNSHCDHFPSVRRSSHFAHIRTLASCAHASYVDVQIWAVKSDQKFALLTEFRSSKLERQFREFAFDDGSLHSARSIRSSIESRFPRMFRKRRLSFPFGIKRFSFEPRDFQIKTMLFSLQTFG